MALREIIASFGIELTGQEQLEKANKKVDGLSQQLLGLGKAIVGAFAVTAIVDWSKEVLASADALAKQSQALGVSAAELQGWQHAAALSGSSAEEFSAAFTKFTRNVNEASEAAAGPAAKAFKDLGVSVKDSAGKLGAPINLLDGVVAGLENIQDPAKRTALVMDLFGKSGAKLLPLFSEGKEGIAKLRAEVAELGFGFDEAFLENAQEVNDNLDRLKLGLRGLGIQVLSAVLPGITEFSKKAVALAKTFVGWIKGTKAIQAGLATLAAGGIVKMIAKVGGLGKALTMLGRFAMRALLPFLILEDALVFLAGGKSAIGKGLDKMFGAGTADAAREAILKWFNDIKAVVVNDVVPALKSIVESDLFKGVAKGGLDAIIVALSTIGLLLTDVDARAQALASTLKKSAAALGLGPSEEEAAAAIEAGKPENRKELSPAASFFRKGFTTVFGDPLDDPEVQANQAANRAVQEKKRMADDGIVAGPAAAPTPFTSFFAQPDAAPIGAPTGYYDATRATASAPAAGGATTSNVVNNVSPSVVNNVTVNGTEDVGNRVNKAVQKGAAQLNLRAVRDALVPKPI